MKRSRIRAISDKQKEKNRIWNEITNRAAFELNYICQYCGKRGQRTNSEAWDYLDGHHIVKRRFNVETKENCFICHRLPCHGEIHDKNIVVS